MKVRQAGFNDIGPVVALSHDAIKSGAWGNVPFNLPHSIRMATTLIENGLVFVVESEDRVVGLMGLRLQDWAWAPGATYVESLVLYVRPEFRNGQCEFGDGRKALPAQALIATIIDLCKQSQFPALFPAMFGDQVEPRDRFLLSCGLEYVGGNFLFTPNAAAAKDAAE